MRQVWTIRHGGPEVLTIRELPDPEPGDGEIRIQVRAVGVNFADILIRVGLYPEAPRLPAVIGYEVAGVVDALGPGVKAPGVGQRVVALLPSYGGYSDSVCLPASEAVPFPETIPFQQAAAIPVNYMTAWLMLVELARVEAGQWVLVHSAAGGVGQAAVQICRWRGARVIGTAGTAKHPRLRESGVEYCIDSSVRDFAREVRRLTGGRGVDIALDALGGRALAQSYRCLAPLGRLFTFGVSRMVTGRRRNLLHVVREWLSAPRFHPIELLQSSRGVFGVTLGCLKDDVARRRRMLEELVTQVGEGTLAPIVDRTFALEQAAESHQYLQDRRNFGKVVLLP